MPEPLITLTTDFGTGSPYVAALKGVILGINPWARLIDLSHTIPPQDLHHVGFFLRTVLPCFAAGPIHVVVVDPGVGSDRHLLYVEVAGHRLLVPDNGCWTSLDSPGPAQVRRLTEPRFWRQPVSATFHGRDILAPVAAHLSLGLDPADLGPVASDWERLEQSRPTFDRASDCVRGRVQFVDPFGNLITDISSNALYVMTQTAPAGGGQRSTRQMHNWPASLRVRVGDAEVGRYVRTYADAEPGRLVFLFSSDNLLEVAVTQGNAARDLGASVGTPVAIVRGE